MRCALVQLVHKMKSESKSLLTAQTEKPNHYSYLKEFRVEQCPLFLQHKCTQHRPFTCFHWHFMNQRRRRPVRRRDGTFNYSADNYCTKFDETTGVCPEGDECPYLHRTAGDTERRYHLRYYKTGMCVHDTDARGFCVKNGPHCAFAHGSHDLRPAVYDIKELQALENPESDANAISNGPNVLDKERNLMNEDPKWQDTSYVLANYKTELCKRPPRLCRQGYACPQYHNSKDKRRSPRKYKYRSTPCPNVKHGDEWGEPGNCDSGDQCPYCHTRTEQQFHPEIYKSTKCNDVQTAGYCPRGVFCAFAHVEQEMNLARDLAACVDSGMNLADILSSALPSEKRDSTCQDSSKRDEKSSDSSNGSGEVSESASTSSLGSNSSHSKAPGSQLQHHKNGSHHTFGSIGNNHHENDIRKHIMEIDSDPLLNPLEKAQKKQSIYLAHSINTSTSLGSAVSPLALPFYDTVESVVGNALEDISLDDPLNLAVTLDKELETESPTISNSISAGLASSGMLGSSAPVNIPGSALNERNSIGNFSPSTSSPLQQLQSSFLSTTRFSHQDSLDTGSTFLNPSHIQLSSSTSKIGSFTSGSLFDFSHQNMSPSNCANQHSSSSILNSFSLSSSVGANLEVQRLCEELATCKSQLASWEERIAQARTACEAWQHEAEESTRKANIAEKQRDEALSQAKALQKEVDLLQGSPYLHGLRRVSELKTLSLSTLKSLQAQLRSDLEEIEKVIYLQTATKCMVCEEGVRSVTLNPCNHYVLCSKCATTQKECPYCQTPVT